MEINYIYNNSRLIMPDTIRAKVSGYRLETESLPPDWKRSNYSTEASTGHASVVTRSSCILTHVPSGLRVGVNNREVRWVEFSVLRVLFGTNEVLSTGQDEIERGICKALQIISQVANLRNAPWRFTRVDIAIHVPGRISEFIPAHEQCRCPGIKRLPVVYPGESINWYGSRLKVRMYDKSLEQRGIEGSYVRVEVELHGPVLEKHLGGGKPVSELRHDACYEALRNIVLGLCPRGVSKASSIASLLALADADGCVTRTGERLSAVYLRSVTKRQTFNIRRDMAAQRPQYFGIDWHELLPPPTSA